MSTSYQLLSEITKFIGKVEDDEFDIKEAGKKPTELIAYIHGFLNGKQECGYLIIGFAEGAQKQNAQKQSTFQLENHKMINLDFVNNTLSNGDKKEIQEMRLRDDSIQKSVPITVVDYLNYFQKKIFSQMEKQTTNWPPIEERNKLLQIEAIPVLVNTLQPDHSDHSNKNYIIILKIKQSPFRPHALVGDIAKSESQINPKYHIRRGRRDDMPVIETTPKSHPIDGCNGTMTPRELGEEMNKLAMRSFNKEVSLHYAVYGELAQQLFEFATNANTIELKKLLDECPGLLTSTDFSGHTILHYAIWYGEYQENAIATLLIDEYGMSLYHSDNHGQTPLLACGYVGNQVMAEKILNLDCDTIYQRDRNGNNLFLISSIYDHLGLIKHLAENFPDDFYDAKNYKNLDVLLVSVCSPSIQVFNWLLNESNHPWSEEEIKKAIKQADDANLEIQKSASCLGEEEAAFRVACFHQIQQKLEEYCLLHFSSKPTASLLAASLSGAINKDTDPNTSEESLQNTSSSSSEFSYQSVCQT